MAWRSQVARISHRSDDPNEHIYLHKIPLGVSVGHLPVEFPVFVMARKLAPALVTGNTVVVKSSEVTPLTCARICRALDRVRRRRDAAEGHVLRHHGPRLDGRRQREISRVASMA